VYVDNFSRESESGSWWNVCGGKDSCNWKQAFANGTCECVINHTRNNIILDRRDSLIQSDKRNAVTTNVENYTCTTKIYSQLHNLCWADRFLAVLPHKAAGLSGFCHEPWKPVTRTCTMSVSGAETGAERAEKR